MSASCAHLRFTRKVVVLVLCAFGMFAAEASFGKQTVTPAIQQQLELPEHKIDIGIAALTFAKEIYPDLDIQSYSRRIDVIAGKARRLANGTQDPETRIRVLNTVLYLTEGFHYDHSSDAQNKQETLFLNGILDTKQGVCYSMSLLYMAVAQRLGYPVYPVAAPDHIFVRYVAPTFTKQNIEATSGGKYFTDVSYIEDFSVSQRGLKSGSYLRTLTYREFLGHMLAANAVALGRKGKAIRAIAYLRKAIELDPRFADYYDNLRIAHTTVSAAVDDVDRAVFHWEKAEYYAKKAKELGFVDPSRIAIGKATRGKK